MAHDALLCISQKTTINNSQRTSSNPNIYFKDSKEMFELYDDLPEIIENNFLVSINCNFFPKEVTPRLPKFNNKEKLSEKDLLIKLTKNGLKIRLKQKNITDANYYDRIEYELKIIIKMGYEGYFLILNQFP